MRKLQTILVMSVMAASLFAAAGTAWARSDTVQRGTAWTDNPVPVFTDSGISWEDIPLVF